jgi:hypothetical protein
MNLLYCAGCRHAFVTPAGNDSQLDGIDERWEEHFFLPELDQPKTDAWV